MKNYIGVEQESGKQFYLEFKDKGKIVMLNLLRFKPIADYSNFENLKPETEISGKEAYDLYMKHTLPLLRKAGGNVLYCGKSNNFLIGPTSEKWDLVLLVEHTSVEKFMLFAQDPDYLKILGHRTASIEDSRLLPTSRFADK